MAFENCSQHSSAVHSVEQTEARLLIYYYLHVFLLIPWKKICVIVFDSYVYPSWTELIHSLAVIKRLLDQN